ncbi:pyruvate kinase-like protein [Apiospora marii]|uniref:Pyruvate kinase-like protein n=1 Tax=Apiospora marii TaxID=335849 RepID=A0ABR1SHD3_9PEZI
MDISVSIKNECNGGDELAYPAAPLPPKDVLLCVRTGKIRPLANSGGKIRSAIHKQPRAGPVYVGLTGLAGDEVQYELHGGPDKALHQYAASHYAAWNAELPGREDRFRVGGFGENLSTALLNEENVCIGDRFRIGDEGVGVEVVVGEPRQPCFKLNHRFAYKRMSSAAQRTGRTGWYLRVLKTGYIREGDAYELVERVHPTWPLARVQRYLYHETDNVAAMRELVEGVPELGAEIRGVFRRRLESRDTEDFAGRLEGERLPMDWRSYRLVEKADLTTRAKKFVFEAYDTAETNGKKDEEEDFAQGIAPHVRLRFGPDQRFSRAYSVVSGNLRRFELGVARDDNSRGGSVYLHDSLHVGDIVKVANGHQAKLPSEDDVTDGKDCIKHSRDMKHVYIVGGIGITAFLLSICQRSSSDNFVVHYAVRSKKDAAYLDRLPESKTTLYAKDKGQRLNLPNIIPKTTEDILNTSIYCCGPSSLLTECRQLTQDLGYPRSRTYFEEFGGASSTFGTGNPFEVEVKSTHQILQVPGEKSLLDVLNEAGFEIESSCLVGNCGTCMVDYSCNKEEETGGGGEVMHQGFALSDEQKGDSMLSCVSRAKGRITIDC